MTLSIPFNYSLVCGNLAFGHGKNVIMPVTFSFYWESSVI